jgi:hypothetical protein
MRAGRASLMSRTMEHLLALLIQDWARAGSVGQSEKKGKPSKARITERWPGHALSALELLFRGGGRNLRRFSRAC